MSNQIEPSPLVAMEVKACVFQVIPFASEILLYLKMHKAMIRIFLIFLFLIMNIATYAQDKGVVEERIVSKTISIDSLKKVEYLEDLLDSFPKKDYFIYWCHITRSGQGFVTTSHVIDNDNNRYHPLAGTERRPIVPTLFEFRDRPVKPGQKYLFDRIFIRKFKDKNNSEPWPSLELYITN